MNKRTGESIRIYLCSQCKAEDVLELGFCELCGHVFKTEEEWRDAEIKENRESDHEED